MARVFLQGASLLGILSLGHRDPECRVAIDRTYLKDSGQVQLHCNVTGNVTSLVWTRDGHRVPADPTEPAKLLINVPNQSAKGYFECLVRCGDVIESASMRLDKFGRLDIGMDPPVALGAFLGVVLLGMILVPAGCYYRRSYLRRMRAARGSTSDLATTDGHAIPLSAQPLVDSQMG